MRYRLMIVCILAVVMTACGQKDIAVDISPLPTAVGPETGVQGVDVGSWAITFEHVFPSGFWGVGVHRYSFYVHCPIMFQEDIKGEWVLFESSNDEVLQIQPMYLRLAGISSGILSSAFTDIIHPDQETIAVVTLLGMTENMLSMVGSECSAFIAWDDKGATSMVFGDPFQP